jgi:adenosylhomocysteine nucleosidase
MPKAPVTAALLAALSQEVRPFLRRIRAKRLPQSDLPAWEFAFAGRTGVAALSGLGELAAARAAAFILDHYQPQVFISLGFGGALTPELPPGALVLGETLWRYEPETGALQELALPPFPVLLQDLAEKLQTAGLPAFQGSVVTTPSIIHKLSQGSPLLGLVHPVLDLETGAAAECIRGSGLPFLALRAVTDAAGEEIPDFIRQAVQAGNQPSAGTALAWLAGDPRRLAALVRLWRRSRLAAERLAQALEVVLNVL